MDNSVSAENMQSSRKAATWYPTKFVEQNGKWVANPRAVHPGSILTATLVADVYADAIRSHARGQLIDLGCGNAPFFGLYGPLVDQATWADWEGTLHDGFKKDVVIDLNQPFPITSASYDTVFMSDVLEHLIYPDATVKEIARILRPGGIAIIGVPFMYWLHEQPFDFHRFTRFKLERMAKDAGMDVVWIKESGGGPDVIHDVFMKMTFRSRKVLQRTIALALVRMYQGMRRIWPLNRYVRKWREKLPLGYVAVFRRPLEKT